MRILILADSDSPHTMRWAKSISKNDITIGIFSLHKPNFKLYDDYPNITLFSLNLDRALQSKVEASFLKLLYFNAIKIIKKLIKEFKPDILHSHYASSYGLLGALTGFRPYIISVWGSDVFSFPNLSFVHKWILMYSLSKADRILSTSKTMKIETQRFTDKNIDITPFGIDISKFKPIKERSLFAEDDLVIGTIKSLEKNYGISFLIRAFKIVKDKYPSVKLKLLIVGHGSEWKKLNHLVNELGIGQSTVFTGYVEHSEVQIYHNMLDIYVAVSLKESFGVSVLEASACEKPVVVSNVGGLPEVVDNSITGIIVESKNSNQLADALITLINNPDLRKRMGDAGRLKVLRDFSWDSSVKKMLMIYSNLLNNKN